MKSIKARGLIAILYILNQYSMTTKTFFMGWRTKIFVKFILTKLHKIILL